MTDTISTRRLVLLLKAAQSLKVLALDDFLVQLEWRIEVRHELEI